MPHVNPVEARAWRRRWWAALPPERKQEKAAVANRRATEIRRWLDARKISRGCVDCGYDTHHATFRLYPCKPDIFEASYDEVIPEVRQ